MSDPIETWIKDLKENKGKIVKPSPRKVANPKDKNKK